MNGVFNIFSALSRHRNLFQDLESQEKELVKYYREFPGDWMLHKDLVRLLNLIESKLTNDIGKIEKSDLGVILELINNQFSRLITQLSNHSRFIEKELNRIRRGKGSQNLSKQLIQSMQNLIDSLHTLYLFFQFKQAKN